MNKNRKNLLAIGLILLIIVLGVASVFVSSRLSSQRSVAPNAPESLPQAASQSCSVNPAAEQCPGTDGILHSCHPDDGKGFTNDSICDASVKGRVETCGNVQYCCPTTGTVAWTTDMTRCPVTPTVTESPTAVAECGNCSAKATCSTGLTCDSVDGKCKKTDGTSVCWQSAAACAAELVVAGACVPTGVVTCTPDCPTACGTAASTITTCKNSCNVATTKACPATAACAVLDIDIIKTAYWNEDANTAGVYDLQTEIGSVSKDQTFVYLISIENVSEANATNVTISDTLTGQKQDLLTYIDADAGCSYGATDRKITCSGISLAAGAKTQRAFRTKVSNTAVNGDVIKNTGKVTFGTITKEATKDLTVSTIVSCNHTCTSDSECDGSLVCDTTANKCRDAACPTVAGCTCPTATVAPTPTLARCNRACDVDSDCIAGLICDTATSMCRNEACTTKTNCVCTTATATAAPITEPTEPGIAVEPTVLPETGILDFPGVAAFGGGLLLAIIGILLAL